MVKITLIDPEPTIRRSELEQTPKEGSVVLKAQEFRRLLFPLC
jgi:hypothetical protein